MLIKTSKRLPSWPDESIRLARRVAMARWRDQGWSIEFIASVFQFTPAYVRMELAELESDAEAGKAVAMARHGRRLRDPAARIFRRRTMWELKQRGFHALEI